MKTSEKGIEMIKGFEGLRLEAYDDGAGVLTIGYGHTKGVYKGQTCTEEQAEAWLRSDLEDAENVVNAMGVELRQCQFDALVSFVFNLGGQNFSTSTLRRKVIANPGNPSIRDEFEKWIYAGGRIMPGLVSRREREADMYFSE